ncbi:MAG: tryptophan synthase subunit alpha [Anaerolineales bacterium]|nr:tryptophan synthase subunit alpha [Anaerolineales bacterium]MCX7756067.1 tryptophan synthase subunit alpha [Anaerolineales bacterium]MDW8278544.1 tryptophan synthase subunit alpha [Anaerolineales bacterium]
MNRLQTAFRRPPIFMPYFPVGYPDLPASIDVLEVLARNGADLIEVGLSFSDPLADGPVIQQATQVALQNGVTTRDGIAAIAELRRRGVEIPLLLMGYYNPILAYGLRNFVRDAVQAGADGFILPDLPPEEADEFRALLDETQTPLVTMLAPTTSDERMERIARRAQGFIYLVSVTGVTGERSQVTSGLSDLIARVRRYTEIPVCVGFGISTPEQAAAVGQLADGVIVGSACVRAVGGSADPVQAAAEFAQKYRLRR